MLGGAILGGVTLTGVGVLSDPVLLTVSYCLSMVGLNMMLAPAVAVLSDRVPMRLRGTMSALYGGGLVAGQALGTLIGAAFIDNALPGFVLGGLLMAVGGIIALVLWPRERSAADLPANTGGLKDLLLSFRPPRNAPDFYKAFVGRLLMLVSYQMITAYQLYIVQDHVGQTTKESAATIATMSVITMVVSLLASVGAGPISDRIGRRKVPVVVASVLFAVGIAIGSGSDVAKETGGIVLVRDDVRDVVTAIRLSRATMRKIKQNLFWAFVYNSIGVPIAALGFLNPIIAAAAMALSSLSVIVNSALLKGMKLARA